METYGDAQSSVIGSVAPEEPKEKKRKEPKGYKTKLKRH